MFASLTAYTIIASYWTTFLLIGGREDVDDPKDLNAKIKIALNDRTLWDPMVLHTYLFSKADKLINWQSVLEHARDAESRGTPVFVEMFEKSSHCAHIRAKEDAKRYWSVVQKLWDTRVDGVGELVEDEAGERRMRLRLRLRKLMLNFRCWDCEGHGRQRRGVLVRTVGAEASTLMNGSYACGGVVPLEGAG